MATKTEVENAVIRFTTLGYEDHGVLTAFIHLDFKGGGQGFGGFGLDNIAEDDSTERSPHPAAGLFIGRVLSVLGVGKWEDLKGKHCRIRHSWTKIEAIGHIIEDEWFDPQVEFELLRKKLNKEAK